MFNARYGVNWDCSETPLHVSASTLIGPTSTSAVVTFPLKLYLATNRPGLLQAKQEEIIEVLALPPALCAHSFLGLACLDATHRRNASATVHVLVASMCCAKGAAADSAGRHGYRRSLKHASEAMAMRFA
eukprot:2954333-Pleurochrysis_carterae.AAC.1